MCDHCYAPSTLLNGPICLMTSTQGLLGSRDRVLKVVVDEAQQVADKHGRPRRSRILLDQPGAPAAELDIKAEDVIPNTPSLITVSSKGFIKRMPTTDWGAQKRGGKGKGE